MAARNSRKQQQQPRLTGSSSSSKSSSVVGRLSSSVSSASSVGYKLLRGTGKAAWIAGTTFLILVVPLIIEMDREQMLNEMEFQQSNLLGIPAPTLGGAAGFPPTI
ncbi:hypothetical protein Droror1_Dr00012638 [Drosera rotundifolia]